MKRYDVIAAAPPGTVPTEAELREIVQAVRAYRPTSRMGRLRRWRLLFLVWLFGVPTDKDIRDALAPRCSDT